jgi:prepilin-type N-terminal cleavage/methylation domain-containing protein
MLVDMRKGPIRHKTGREKTKQGFTLTEIAIVLGIIGLILGAIWVAAAAVYSNMRTSKTTTELLHIVQDVRAMYATSGTVDGGADMSGFQVQSGKALTYIQAGMFPTDSLNAVGANATSAEDPWGGYINVKAATNQIANDSFQVSFDKVPQSACISIITGTTGTGKDPGLIGVSNGASGTVPTAVANTVMPVAASTAQTTYCAAATQSIGFTFTLK